MTMRRHLKDDRRLRPALSVSQILAWADACRERTGEWPKKSSGRIAGALGDTWTAVELALRGGWRGLPGGSSLAQLLAERRGVRNEKRLPRLAESQIPAWADTHHHRTGKWPNHNSGPVNGAPGETWHGINTALGKGGRGLPRRWSLARLLERHRGRRHRKRLPRLTHKQILRWADAHRHRWGKWPTSESGLIEDASAETWNAIEVALRRGHRGLPGESSLAQLLTQRRGARNKKRLPKLTHRQILAWADAHHERTGKWPHSYTGRISAAPQETWLGVDKALRSGGRGLRGRASLFRLLRKHRKMTRVGQRPCATVVSSYSLSY